MSDSRPASPPYWMSTQRDIPRGESGGMFHAGCAAAVRDRNVADSGDQQWGKPTVAVDLDMTLTAVPWERWDYIADPQPEARRVLQRFVEAGWRVVIHTCRPDTNFIREWADRHFPGLITGVNHNPDPAATGFASTPKPFASIYIDDKAWPLRGDPVNWQDVEADMEDRGIFDRLTLNKRNFNA